MHEYSKRIADCIKAHYGSIENIEGENLCELEKWAKIIKDLTEYDINKRIIEEMDECEKLEKLEDKMGGRMGYRGRDSRGRFVHRPGRGRSAGMGYTPYLHMMPGIEDMYDEDYMDMIPENYRMGYSDGRSGNYGGRSDGGSYSGQSGNTGRYGYDDGRREGSKYGRSYDEYRQAKRHYTETKDPEHQKKMKDSIAEVFDDMEDITVDVVKDLTPEEKQRYRQKLQQMMQKIQ